jgi:hypothetical protein
MTMKNWYGLLGGRRNQFHQHIHSIISDFALMIQPTLVVLDGMHVLMSNGPTGGRLSDVKEMGTVVAGTDMVSVDSYGYTKLLGRDLDNLEYIHKAHNRGLGKQGMGKNHVEGGARMSCNKDTCGCGDGDKTTKNVSQEMDTPVSQYLKSGVAKSRNPQPKTRNRNPVRLVYQANHRRYADHPRARLSPRPSFFLLFLFFVIITDLRYLKGYPVSLFLELDPLVGVATAITTGTVYKALILGLILLLPTLCSGGSSATGSVPTAPCTSSPISSLAAATSRRALSPTASRVFSSSNMSS